MARKPEFFDAIPINDDDQEFQRPYSRGGSAKRPTSAGNHVVPNRDTLNCNAINYDDFDTDFTPNKTPLKNANSWNANL